MGDVDVLGRQLARYRLRQAAQAELAHGKGRGVGIALNAGRGAGEQDRAPPARGHALGRGLRHQKAAIACDRQRPFDIGRAEFDNWPAAAVARIVDDDVGHAEIGVDGGEKTVHVARPNRITGLGAAADFRR